jgi:hypothetical protein
VEDWSSCLPPKGACLCGAAWCGRWSGRAKEARPGDAHPVLFAKHPASTIGRAKWGFSGRQTAVSSLFDSAGDDKLLFGKLTSGGKRGGVCTHASESGASSKKQPQAEQRPASVAPSYTSTPARARTQHSPARIKFRTIRPPSSAQIKTHLACRQWHDGLLRPVSDSPNNLQCNHLLGGQPRLQAAVECRR